MNDMSMAFSGDGGLITAEVNFDAVTLKATQAIAVNNSTTKSLTVIVTNGQQTRTFTLAPGSSQTVNLPNGFVLDQVNSPMRAAFEVS